MQLRSRFEKAIKKDLHNRKIDVKYEGAKLKYSKLSTYTPDWVFPNGLLVESKGYFTAADINKHKLIRAQHPGQEIRFLFQNAKNKLYKGASTTYKEWCDKQGFKWAEGSIPDDWVK